MDIGFQPLKLLGLLPENQVVRAMYQVLVLAEDAGEVGERLRDIVQAAIEQFNEGSPARAATMLGIAERFIGESRIDLGLVASIRTTAPKVLSPDRLRELGDNADRHPLLRRILGFFREFAPHGLLDQLQFESKRERRRLLLGLLEVQGNSARMDVLQRLELYLTSRGATENWYFTRNLVYLLHRIPRPAEAPIEREVGLVAGLLLPSKPMPLLREVITDLGQIRHPRAEEALISFLEALEEILRSGGSSPHDPARLNSLLDRLVMILAQKGTARAVQAVVDHGLKQQPELGDTMARIASLSGQNLSAHVEVVGRLVKTLKSETPRKVLGVVIQKNIKNLTHLIKALSSTSSLEVKQVLEDIARRFPDQEFGKIALADLRHPDAADRRSPGQTATLQGKLEPFGLPDLLQKMAQSRASGGLTIKDSHGRVVGNAILRQGKMMSCQVGSLRDQVAMLQLLERPEAGTFVLQAETRVAFRDGLHSANSFELVPLIVEGMRRYDALLKARALVPDGAPLQPRGAAPTPDPFEPDTALFHAAWKKASAGTTPEQCEADLPADACSIRCLLARWVEESVLAVK